MKIVSQVGKGCIERLPPPGGHLFEASPDASNRRFAILLQEPQRVSDDGIAIGEPPTGNLLLHEVFKVWRDR